MDIHRSVRVSDKIFFLAADAGNYGLIYRVVEERLLLSVNITAVTRF